MFRSFLKMSILITLLMTTKNIFAQGVTGISGYCQNLVVNLVNFTDVCNSKVVRFDLENRRFIYVFTLKNNYALSFSGNLDTIETIDGNSDSNYYTRMTVDKVYFGNDGNPAEKSIDGRCSLLGNVEYGLTISCRSNDTARRFSALFFSPGDIKFTPIN